MDILDTLPNGGFPLKSNDLRFIDSIYRNGIHAVLGAFAETAVLSGFVGTVVYQGGIHLEFTQGWLVVNGELGFIPAQPYVSISNGGSSANYKIVPNNYDDLNTVKMLQSGTSITPYKIRQYKIEPVSNTNQSYPNLSSILPLTEVLKQKLGLTISREYATGQIQPFVWSTQLNCWRSVTPHNKGNSIFNIKGFNMIFNVPNYGVIMGLPASFSYYFSSSHIEIIDKSTQTSNSSDRAGLESGTYKFIYEI